MGTSLYHFSCYNGSSTHTTSRIHPTVKTMQQQYHIRGLIALLVCSGVLLSSLGLSYYYASTSLAVETTQLRGAFESEIDIDPSHRSLSAGWFERLFSAPIDPKTVTPRLPLEDSTIVSDQQDDTSFVVPEANLISETGTPPFRSRIPP